MCGLPGSAVNAPNYREVVTYKIDAGDFHLLAADENVVSVVPMECPLDMFVSAPPMPMASLPGCTAIVCVGPPLLASDDASPALTIRLLPVPMTMFIPAVLPITVGHPGQSVHVNH